MKFIKHIKRGICILLATVVLACSPISCYMDTQQIVTVEAASVELSGFTLMYIFSQLLGYDTGTVNSYSLWQAFCKFVNNLDTLDSKLKAKVISLTSPATTYSDTVDFGDAKSVFVQTLASFLANSIYTDIRDYSTSASTDYAVNYADISFEYSRSSPSGYYYNRMPSTARTASFGHTINTELGRCQTFIGYEHAYYFAVYSERENCYYMHVGGYNDSDVADGSHSEYVLFADGLYLATFDSSNYITACETVDMYKYISYTSAYSFDRAENSDGSYYTLAGNSTAIANYLYNDLTGTPFQISTDYCTLKPIQLTYANFMRSQVPKNMTGLKGLQDSSYASPCTESRTITNHYVTDTERAERLCSLEVVNTSDLLDIANSYDKVIADSSTWTIADTYPAIDLDDTEDKIIADVYPKVDDVKEASKDNTGSKDDTSTGTGGIVDTGTDDKTDTGTKDDVTEDTSGFWATLWNWLEKIYNAVKMIALLSDIFISTKSIEATISATVVGALQNIGAYDIDIWDTTKDILGKVVSIDDLSATFNPDKLIADTGDIVISTWELNDTGTHIREGIDALVTDISNIGQYDIDVWDILSDIDEILTNGSVVSLAGWLADIWENTDFLTDIFTDFPATIAEILSAILSLPLSIAQAIIDLLADLLKALFIPDTVALEAELTGFTGKFPWVSELFAWASYLKSSMNTSEPPKIYIHFEDSQTSKYQPLGTLVIFDASWYAPYKSYGDAVLSSFLWAIFLWRLFKHIPSIINGAGMVTEQSIKFEDKMDKGD